MKMENGLKMKMEGIGLIIRTVLVELFLLQIE